MTTVKVTLRIEGIAQTIFEGDVNTKGHIVSTRSGGEHLCDGTQCGGGGTAGPTVTSALDDGAISGGFDWDGTYNNTLCDYFITSIGDRNNYPPRYYWGYFLNYKLSAGGCKQKVKEGDNILFVFDPPKDPTFLKLTGPKGDQKSGSTVSFEVVNAVTGKPLPKEAYVSVNGEKADEEGNVSIKLGGVGIRRFKAESYGCVPSNKWTINVVS